MSDNKPLKILNLMAVRVGERAIEKATLRQYARDLRRHSTDTEKHLFYYLRANQLGHKFKRQVPIGGQHLIDQEKDNQQTARLGARGFTIYRSCFSKYS